MRSAHTCAPRHRRNASANGLYSTQPAAGSPECLCWRPLSVRSFAPCLRAGFGPSAWRRAFSRVLDEETAGVRLIKTAAPDRWRDIVAGYRILSDNRAAIAQCAQNEAKTASMIRFRVGIGKTKLDVKLLMQGPLTGVRSNAAHSSQSPVRRQPRAEAQEPSGP